MRNCRKPDGRMHSVKQIYLVRHCKANGQEATASLTEEGLLQSERLADSFFDKNIEFIISSPFERAIASIRPFSNRMGLHIHIEDRLRERVLSANDLPDWMDQLKETFDDLDLKLHGGESSREAMDRGVEVIKQLFNREENRIVVVTHGNLMSLILKHYDQSIGFEEWQALSNPDVFELRVLENTGEMIINRMWK